MSDALHDYRVAGVHVQCVLPSGSDDRPSLVLVHGGLHGSWNWQRFAPILGARGWACHALDWYGHYKSDPLAEVDFVSRGIADVVEEIGIVAAGLDRPPVLMGHSMGGLACLKYAEQRRTAALVLLAPVLPAVIGNVVPGMEVDLSRPWGPPPFEIAAPLFFGGVPEDEARSYYDLLCPESPRCVAEATGGAAVDVQLDEISSPVFVLVGEEDRLTPVDRVQQLAGHLGADFRRYPGRSHSLLIDRDAELTAEAIADWLAAQNLG